MAYSSNYDIIYLSGTRPASFATDEEWVRAQIEQRNQRNGKAIGIVKFINKLALDIEAQWDPLIRRYIIENLTGTQFVYAFERPRVMPVFSDIHQVYEADDITPDSPKAEIEDTITIDYIRDEPASLSRRAFGTRKEVVPRLRHYLQVDAIPEGGVASVPMQFPVMVKRKEYTIRFKCYAHTNQEASLIVNGLEHYLDIRQEYFYELGAQKFHVVGSASGVEQDKDTGMFYRMLDFYLRLEVFYLGEGAVLINKIDMEWGLPDGGLSVIETTVEHHTPELSDIIQPDP